MPVLSRSLIGDRTARARLPGTAAKQWQSTEALKRDRVRRIDLPRPASGRSRFLHKARSPRPSEPILIPKLRIQFADFPYLHYSIDQRLLTLETCCGYGYELVRIHRNLPGIFKVPPTARGCRKKCGTLRHVPKPILPARGFQGLGGLCRKDNSSQSFGGRLPVALRCHDEHKVRLFRHQVLECGPDSLSAAFRLARLHLRTFDQGFP